MNKNQRPCPICGKPMHRQSKLCRKCSFNDEWRNKLSTSRKGKPSYERTEEHRQKMSQSLKGITHPSGWKHSPNTRNKIAAAWTDEMKEAARQRGIKNAQNRE